MILLECRLAVYIDFVVCVGGDGVILHASYLFKRAIPPVSSSVFVYCTSFGNNDTFPIIITLARDALHLSGLPASRCDIGWSGWLISLAWLPPTPLCAVLLCNS